MLQSRRAAASAAALLTLTFGGFVAATATAATAPLLKPRPVASFENLDVSTQVNVTVNGGWSLRPDGSLGRLKPYTADPIELFTVRGPVPAGQVRRRVVSDRFTQGAEGPTALAAAGGFDWLIAFAREPTDQPGWPDTLVAIDDRGTVAQSRRLELGTRSRVQQLVATGAGMRILVARGKSLEVRRADNRRIATLRPAAWASAAAGRADGSILVAGPRTSTSEFDWVLTRVSRTGKVTQVRDSRGRLVPLYGELTSVRGGVVFSGRPGQRVSLLTDRGVLRTRSASDLQLPWSRDCRASGEEMWASPLPSGPSGLPVMSIECGDEGDRIGRVHDRLIVGLDAQLNARWAVRPKPWGDPVVGADGRWYMFRSARDPQLVAWREPGAPATRRGRVVSVRRGGRGAAVTIRCNAPAGSVCSGTVRLSRGGPGAKRLPYALPGRPGNHGALIRRHFDGLPRGSGPLRATLGA